MCGLSRCANIVLVGGLVLCNAARIQQYESKDSSAESKERAPKAPLQGLVPDGLNYFRKEDKEEPLLFHYVSEESSVKDPDTLFHDWSMAKQDSSKELLFHYVSEDSDDGLVIPYNPSDDEDSSEDAPPAKSPESEDVPCADGFLPEQCIVYPGRVGDEWRSQLKASGCRGNVIVVAIQRSFIQAAAASGAPHRSQPGFIGLRVDDTHDLSDPHRTVPAGLKISETHKGSWWSSQGLTSTLTIEHRDLSLDLQLLPGSYGAGLGGPVSLANTQRLTVTNSGDELSWETSTKPSMLSQIGNAAGLKWSSIYHPVAYHPMKRNTVPVPMVRSAYLKRCLDESLSRVHLRDEVDKESGQTHSSDDSDDSSTGSDDKVALPSEPGSPKKAHRLFSEGDMDFMEPPQHGGTDLRREDTTDKLNRHMP